MNDTTTEKQASKALAAAEPAPRNILVFTLGGAPGVVTETVWALLDNASPWAPDEIHLVTTTFGAKVWADPASRPNSELTDLLAHFGRPPITPFILVPKDRAGNPVTDIRTEPENIAFANALTWHVMELKKRPNTRLHISMAGGRKTMSSYSQAALSYFAEEHDALTHILIDPPSLEYSPDFFWPKQAQGEIDVSSRPPPPPTNIVPASTAKIELVPCPFLKLRAHIKRIPFASKDNFDHWTLTEKFQERLDAYAATVTLRVADSTLVIAGAPIRVGFQEFALYRVIATALDESWEGVGPEGQGGNHRGWVFNKDLEDRRSRAYRSFIEFYGDCFPGAEDEDYRKFMTDADKAFAEGEASGMAHLATRFKSMRSRVKEQLLRRVTSYAIRKRVTPDSRWTKEAGGWRYGLALERHEIEIVKRAREEEA